MGIFHITLKIQKLIKVFRHKRVLLVIGNHYYTGNLDEGPNSHKSHLEKTSFEAIVTVKS
jgi:hypothetical protein